MMERMFKRVGLHSGKKVVDTENEGNVECESVECSNVMSSAPGDRSPGSGDLQWCDLLSFKNVCAEAADRESAGGSENQLGGSDEASRRPRRLRVFNFPHLDTHIMEFKPRAITRRLCGGRKHDNELYRSNSFKFERFERVDEGASLQKQVGKHAPTYSDNHHFL
ncbi:hypothetical protein R5R35_013167 [Gryllus longicercus]|uniref:Uncharacterized protein n=1 Tax=Gryllus longicercus TaxID=2509291 RepID=A0AAN9V7F6_9ORTH